MLLIRYMLLLKDQWSLSSGIAGSGLKIHLAQFQKNLAAMGKTLDWDQTITGNPLLRDVNEAQESDLEQNTGPMV